MPDESDRKRDKGEREQRSLDDLIDEAIMDSFPASDPPSFWGRDDAGTDESEASDPADREEPSRQGRNRHA